MTHIWKQMLTTIIKDKINPIIEEILPTHKGTVIKIGYNQEQQVKYSTNS